MSSPSALSMSSRQSSPSPPAASRSYELRGVPAGEPIRLRGGIGFGSGVPLRFDALNVAASKLTARLDGRLSAAVALSAWHSARCCVA